MPYDVYLLLPHHLLCDRTDIKIILGGIFKIFNCLVILVTFSGTLSIISGDILVLHREI